MLNAIEISPKVWWVGGLDWNERQFHGYTTERGITYNAYLIVDETVTLIDTVEGEFCRGKSLAAHRFRWWIPPKFSSSSPIMWSRIIPASHSCRAGRLAPDARVVTVEPQGVRGLDGPLRRAELCGRSRRGRVISHRRSAYPAIHPHPNGALAGQHGHLLPGGKTAVFQRRVRSALTPRAERFDDEDASRRRSLRRRKQVLCQHRDALWPAGRRTL